MKVKIDFVHSYYVAYSLLLIKKKEKEIKEKIMKFHSASYISSFGEIDNVKEKKKMFLSSFFMLKSKLLKFEHGGLSSSC